MATAGFMFQLLGFFASIGAVIVYILAVKDKSDSYLKIGNGLLLLSTASIVLASIVLLVALVTSDFSIQYVANYTDLSLPLFYKLSAFWGGQSGSLLFWALLIVLFATVEIFRLKKQDTAYRASVYLACSFAAMFFILLICFVQNPFDTVDFMSRDGRGLNPMLQNPGMVIHPPTLYIGFVGFTIVIAHAFAALVTKNFSSMWVTLTRGWTFIIWVFLTLGIVIGGWWAYVELGWGGYWAWDPVENASLFPWFVATAFIHSAYVYEKKGSMKAWTFALIILVFELTILGTFITRSGVIQSVHSFGANPIGNFFLVFIFVSTAIYLIYMLKNLKSLEDKGEFVFGSREGVLFIGNWLFLGITFVTVLGTFLPWITELAGMQPITVDLSYFNRVTIPFFAAILLASGLGPIIPFGKVKGADFVKRVVPPVVLTVITVVICLVLGYTKLIPIVLIACLAFSFFVTVIKIATRIKKAGIGSLISQNRFFAAMLVHFSLVVMAFGVTMSSFYNYQADEVVKQNTAIELNGYVFRIGAVNTEKGVNYISHNVPIQIYKGDKYISTAYPEMRLYNKHQDNMYAEVSYYSMFKGDLYFIFSGFDLEQDQVRVQAIFQPFIAWIWVGCALMSIGGIYSIICFRRKNESEIKK